MPDLALDGLGKRFGAVDAVRDLSLTVPEGSFVCLLGPSGCGKTTLLRMIAGLEQPSAGRIRLGDEDITDDPVHRRDFGMVFQSLALFPHLTVGENIRYPLKLRGQPRDTQADRERELLSLVQLDGLGERALSQLSGGQRQRVAIARALAVSPRLFLLDEPLSALDAKLREAMQIELRELQQRLGITTLVVTHDQREAMTMADTVVVMERGVLRQAGSPLELYREPRDAFVAGFIGGTNLLPVEAGGDRTIAGGHLTLDGVEASPGDTISIRPEALQVVAAGSGRAEADVRFVRDLGATVEVFLDMGDHTLTAVAMPSNRPDAAPGDRVGIDFDAADAVVLTA